MDGLNATTVGATLVAIISVVLNFTGKKVLKDNAAYFATTNHDLREENATLKTEKTALAAELAAANAALAQKDETIKKLTPFSELAKIVSNNHKDIMETMANRFTDIMTALTGKIDGKP